MAETGSSEHRGGREQLVVADVVHVALAELAELVAAKAAELARREQHAGVLEATRGRDREAAGREFLKPDRHVAERGRELVVADVQHVSTAELPGVVAAPAAEPAAIQRHARVIATGEEAVRRSPQVDHADTDWQLVVTDRQDVAEPQLTVAVLSPTSQLAASQHRARERHGDVDDIDGLAERDRGQIHRSEHIVDVALAELSETVGAPTTNRLVLELRAYA
jgi:hypothetical protein